MGRTSGGVNGSSGVGSSSYDRATDALYAAFSSKSKTGVSKAEKRLEKVISKQSDDVVRTRTLAFSDATYYSHRDRNPKNQYNAAAYNYNKKMSQLYRREAKKRKL